jgi:hypothetical protein
MPSRAACTRMGSRLAGRRERPAGSPWCCGRGSRRRCARGTSAPARARQRRPRADAASGAPRSEGAPRPVPEARSSPGPARVRRPSAASRRGPILVRGSRRTAARRPSRAGRPPGRAGAVPARPGVARHWSRASRRRAARGQERARGSRSARPELFANRAPVDGALSPNVEDRVLPGVGHTRSSTPPLRASMPGIYQQAAAALYQAGTGMTRGQL